MKIERIEAHFLDNIPIQPPPFRKLPCKERALLTEVEAGNGIIGWSMVNYPYPLLFVEVINRYVAPLLIGENPLLIERIWVRLHNQMQESALSHMFTTILSAIDMALWDIKGKALGQPVHHLLGGANDTIPVYVTHGTAYHDAPPYSLEELTAEAAHLVKLGVHHLKNGVARQRTPDAKDDYERLAAVRDTVGPDIGLSIDAAALMTVPQAVRLCKLIEDLDIEFFEEPVEDNNPSMLAALKSQTSVPIAAAQNHRFSCRELLLANAVDIIQPNAANNGGYTAALKIAAMARAFNKPIGHGNGGGPHNIPIQAGLPNGTIVEYHFHKWMTYNAIYENVPQPQNGYLHASQEPGLGLNPKPGLIAEYAVRSGKPIRLMPAKRPAAVMIDEAPSTV